MRGAWCVTEWLWGYVLPFDANKGEEGGKERFALGAELWHSIVMSMAVWDEMVAAETLSTGSGGRGAKFQISNAKSQGIFEFQPHWSKNGARGARDQVCEPSRVGGRRTWVE